jgi:hypothetical protein
MASADSPNTKDQGTRLEETDLTCKSCRHEWKATTLLGGTLEQWVAWLESHKCPACQQNYYLEHQKARDPEEYLKLPPDFHKTRVVLLGHDRRGKGG